RRFLDHLPQEQYPGGSLAAAIYLAGGIRAFDRGTMSEERNPDGSEHLANMEMTCLALPKRVFSLSQLAYVADRIAWLYECRRMIGGLRFTEEPGRLRCFFGRLESIGDWPEQLLAAFKKEMPSGI
ncbi:MAG: tryptophanase, partial [Actinomycetia bacterium]|nr:tryptophanase [Actinomycetes bacterium]